MMGKPEWGQTSLGSSPDHRWGRPPLGWTCLVVASGFALMRMLESLGAGDGPTATILLVLALVAGGIALGR
jgi:hypothetical protein